MDDLKARALAELVTSGALVRAIEEGNIGGLALASAQGGVFVSGGDVRKLAVMDSRLAVAMTRDMRTFCAALSTLPIPTFSLLQGPAYGGGAELALATDFRVAAHPLAALHFWQAKWALPGGWHGMARMSELCPALSPRRVALMFASARSLDRAELLRLGLCEASFDAGSDAEPVAIAQGRLNLPKAAFEFVLDFAKGFSSCPTRLRSDFLRRGNPVAVDASGGRLREEDEAMFARHWFGPEHRARLDAFKTARVDAVPKGNKS